jgi:NADH-quinone oxidoreductase subunit M
MNAADIPVLSIMLAIPMVAAALCLFVRAELARPIALGATLVNFILGVVLWISYDPAGAQWQFTESAQLFGPIGWKLGIDGISLTLIMLSVFLMPICIGASWNSIQKRVGEYMAAFLLMETLMIGVFAAQDLLLFYIFFEAGLIAMLWMIQFAGTADIPTLLNTDFPVQAQTLLWLAFFASFAVKMPMWPVHTWLPDAHVQAPTAGSVILAGVLLKMGGYGFLRFSLPMFPEASANFIGLRPVDGRGCLHIAGCLGAAGYEETDRLFVGRPHGDCDRWPLHL